MRPETPISKTVGIVLLAAGKSTRMGRGGQHKLLAEFDGVPLVRHLTIEALASGASAVTVVTGYRRDKIVACLSGLEVSFVHNPNYASGMATSLIAGWLASWHRSADGVLIMLADMPHVTAEHLRKLISCFRDSGGGVIVRAVGKGRWGNPVILPQSLGDEVQRLRGDIGARHIILGSGLEVIDVDIGEAALIDVDTPEDVIASGGKLKA
jgi:molybdenum cofactor cytidylyltransferase